MPYWRFGAMIVPSTVLMSLVADLEARDRCGRF